MKKKTIFRFAVLFLCSYFITAQITPVEDNKKVVAEFGIETDLFAWRISEPFENFFLGFWTGIPHWKFALSAGAMNFNAGHLPDFVKSNTAYIGQLRADWFLNKELDGFWIGPSLLGELADVISDENYKNRIFMMSGGVTTGYLFKAGHVYFGPSLAVHITFGKPQLAVNENTSHPMPPWSFETGFRFGYQF